MEISKNRVLVVVDEHQEREALSAQLEAAGYAVSTTESGAHTTETLRNESFDIVLTDILMLEGGGFETLLGMGKDKALKPIPVILISGVESVNSIERCIEMGAADYLVKPFTPALLRFRLDSCLRDRRHQGREAELQNLHQKVEEQARQLDELCIRDGLTALYNRSHFEEQGKATLAQAQRYTQPLTVMIGDIDFFKRINDRFSHAVGDEVLRHIARILEESTRQSDMVARYGGEEFVVAFSQTPLFQALPLCEKLRARIEHHEWSDIHPDLKVTMSMGLCDDIQLESFEKLVTAAEERLDEAKTGGRNRVCADGYTEVHGSVELNL